MASSSGSSVIGTQILLSAVPLAERQVSIGLSGDFARPPIRIGFYYAVAYNLTTGLEGRLLSRGPIYDPGVRFLIPTVSLNVSTRYRFWAEWNMAGESWTIFTN